jgi:hypothetical protein
MNGPAAGAAISPRRSPPGPLPSSTAWPPYSARSSRDSVSAPCARRGRKQDATVAVSVCAVVAAGGQHAQVCVLACVRWVAWRAARAVRRGSARCAARERCARGEDAPAGPRRARRRAPPPAADSAPPSRSPGPSPACVWSHPAAPRGRRAPARGYREGSRQREASAALSTARTPRAARHAPCRAPAATPPRLAAWPTRRTRRRAAAHRPQAAPRPRLVLRQRGCVSAQRDVAAHVASTHRTPSGRRAQREMTRRRRDSRFTHEGGRQASLAPRCGRYEPLRARAAAGDERRGAAAAAAGARGAPAAGRAMDAAPVASSDARPRRRDARRSRPSRTR